MRKLISQILAGIGGLWLSSVFVPQAQIRILPDSSFFGISLNQNWQIFALLGIVLGLLNFFIKPVLNAITLPLRIITLGLFGFVVNMGLIWFLDAMFEELYIPWIMPLLITTLIVWGLNAIILKIIVKNED